MQTVPPDEAAQMQESGEWVFIDVRPKANFEKATVVGAKNAELFQSMSFSNVSPKSLLRAAAFALNGVKPVEPNQNFAEDLKAAAGGKKVIVVRQLCGRSCEQIFHVCAQDTSHVAQECVLVTLLRPAIALSSRRLLKI